MLKEANAHMFLLIGRASKEESSRKFLLKLWACTEVRAQTFTREIWSHVEARAYMTSMGYTEPNGRLLNQIGIT